ncbi:MAG: hypothetical protein NXI10_01885 [bacterium]|nr:hypothetical protein [bacterium]
MKKALLLSSLCIIAIATQSCSGGKETEAAKEYCDCFAGVAESLEKEVDSKSYEQISQEMKEAQKCEKKWKKKYDGKIDVPKFKKELKNQNRKVYDMVDRLGAF